MEMRPPPTEGLACMFSVRLMGLNVGNYIAIVRGMVWPFLVR